MNDINDNIKNDRISGERSGHRESRNEHTLVGET